MQYLKEIHGKKYSNILTFVDKMLTFFVRTQKRTIPETIKNMSMFSDAKDSLKYCPSYFLTDYKKKMIVKIFMYAYHFCDDILEDYESKLTMFELFIDYYIFKASNAVREKDKEKYVD